MPIDPLSGISGLSGVSDYRDENKQGTTSEQAQAEELLLSYLLQNYNLDHSRARQVIASIAASGENLLDFVLELQRGNVTAIARIQTFVNQVG